MRHREKWREDVTLAALARKPFSFHWDTFLMRLALPPSPVELSVVKASPIEDATEYAATLKSLHISFRAGAATKIEVIDARAARA